jgi:diaminohydroxyphosphoribosylaminopyrimidine deaminase/5-amino-6-(5-phosphoribosylamino)uracil reductase
LEVLGNLVGKKLNISEAMNVAILEARKGLGYVAPNPPVGCVILDKDFQFLSSGYHKGVGLPHAEIEALQNLPIDTDLKGAHFIVTLEPCAHYGRTPPCADKLASLPIASVTYGLVDPNPLVAGKGAEKIRQANIECAEFTGDKSALIELIEVFSHNIESKSAFVTVKIAQSLDGYIGHKSGASQWISNEEARHYGHYLRGSYDALGVGVETFLRDNPKLNVRHDLFLGKKNKVVLFDPKLRSLPQLKNSQLLKVHKPEEIFLIAAQGLTNEKFSPEGCQILTVPLDKNRLNLPLLGQKLYENQIYSLFVEGGAYTISELLLQGQVQRLYSFIAPTILGGISGIGWTQHFNIEKFEERVRMGSVRYQTMGDNMMITGRVNWPT